MTTDRSLTLLPLFRHALELSKVTEGEVVCVYTENGARSDYADAYIAAAESLGAAAFRVDVPTSPAETRELADLGPSSGLGARPALVEAMKGCDLVVDLVMLLFNSAKMEIQQSGTRMLTCVEPVETILRCLPTPELRAEAIAGRELLAGASRVRIASEAGTDLTYELGEHISECQYGMADEPGRWDHFAGTFVFTAAVAGNVEGTIVFDSYDVITPYINHVRTPVRCKVEAGHLVDIQGGLEADLMRDIFSRFDEDATQLSHIGWGLHPGARWESLMIDPNQIGLDPRAFRGCVLASTGPNNEFGGTNSSPCHFDMPMRNTSFWVDDELIVDAGEVVYDFGAVA
ncbi:MAG: hypothetical protein U0R24_04740 [Solirubrobacterales bacterium]